MSLGDDNSDRRAGAIWYDLPLRIAHPALSAGIGQTRTAEDGVSGRPRAEIYVSTDIEADGPIPGPYSMLSFGSAAYRPDKTLVATYSANLVELPGASRNPDTMAWWEGQPEAWKACRTDPRPPEVVVAAWRDCTRVRCPDVQRVEVGVLRPRS